MLTAEETRGRGKCHDGPHRAGWTVSDEGGGASPRSRRDLHDLLADAVDRLGLVGDRILPRHLAVAVRLDPVAVELVVGPRILGDVEENGAPHGGVEGVAVTTLPVAAPANGLFRVALERAPVAADEVALELVLLHLLAVILDPLAVVAARCRLVADPDEVLLALVLPAGFALHPGEELGVHVEGRDARDVHLALLEAVALDRGALLRAIVEGLNAQLLVEDVHGLDEGRRRRRDRGGNGRGGERAEGEGGDGGAGDEGLEGLALGLGDEGLLGGGDGRVGGHFVVCCVLKVLYLMSWSGRRRRRR